MFLESLPKMSGSTYSVSSCSESINDCGYFSCLNYICDPLAKLDRFTLLEGRVGDKRPKFYKYLSHKFYTLLSRQFSVNMHWARIN